MKDVAMDYEADNTNSLEIKTAEKISFRFRNKCLRSIQYQSLSSSKRNDYETKLNTFIIQT